MSSEMGRVASRCGSNDGFCRTDEGTIVELRLLLATGAGSGRLVLTDPVTYGMPLIRYDTGGVASTATGSCACGWPFRLLNDVEGHVFKEHGVRLKIEGHDGFPQPVLTKHRFTTNKVGL